MRYTVLVAEDEPLALRTVCSIIEKRCPNFRVIATAEDGRDALDKVRELKPDLVISDIKMPLLSGVEMAEIIHRESPDICVLIISGYAEFEYAQSAIRSGVTDYLLKPIVPSSLKTSMDYAEKRIGEIHYYRRNRVIRKIARGEEVPKDELSRFLPFERLYTAVMCRGTLPGRYDMSSKREIYSGIDEQYFIFGRSENEALYLVPDTFLTRKEFQEYLGKLCEKEKENPGFYTLIYRKEATETVNLQEGIRELYNALDMNCRIGESTVLEINDRRCRENYDKKIERELESITWNVNNYTAAGMADKLRREIAHGYELCRERHCSQIQVENWTRELVYSIYRQGGIKSSPNQLELALRDTFSQAENMKDISDGVPSICLGDEAEGRFDKVDSQEFFDRIHTYLRQNLERQISVQSICEMFGISQTYVGKLFRKYAGASFSQTFTQMRIDRAKELFDADPKPYIKDVALAVGYADQFYFSRVFRSYTGKSPTEYMKDEK